MLGAEETISYLKHRLLPACRSVQEETRVSLWIERLTPSTKALVLTRSMAIDIESEAVSPHTFVEVISAADPTGMDPCHHFSTVLNGHIDSGRYSCASRLVANGPADVRYVRVVELTGFIQYFIKPNDGRNLTPDDIWDAWEDIREEGHLGGIPRAWSGRTGRVWVFPQSEFEELLQGAPADRPGTAFFDTLGVPLNRGGGRNGEPFAVAVFYPDNADLSPFQCAQPTTLDADWSSDPVLYLSYGDRDNWGRTQSCTGSGRLCRERVHRHIPRLSDGYKVREIGPSASIAASNEKALLEESRRRFLEFVSIAGHADD